MMPVGAAGDITTWMNVDEILARFDGCRRDLMA